jgi:hypothetical protein
LNAQPRAAAILLALMAIAGALAGCGGDDSSTAAESRAVADQVGGSVAPLALCRDWNEETEAQKQATIADIRRSLTPQSQEESRTSLSDERAYELFERTCRPDFAQGFELYKLYAQAAALAPLKP